MLKVQLVGDNNNGSKVETKTTKRNGTGVKVYTYKGQLKSSATAVFLNDTYGSDMNIDATYSGTPDGIHNGTDTVEWTASAISGTWVFDSTAQAHSGTKSIDATSTTNNNQALFTRSSTIDQTDYTAISGWIYITGWSGSGTKEVRIKLRNGGVDATADIDLSTYVDTGNLNAWQKFGIPLTDFTFSNNNIDEMVVTTIDIGAGQPPDYYLDDMQFEEVGGGVTYSIAPPYDGIWDFENISFYWSDVYDSTLANATVPNISPTGILGESTLTNGINIRQYVDGELAFNLTVKDLQDLLAAPAPTNMLTGGNATTTWLKIQLVFNNPTVLTGITNDRIEIVLNDNLTGFTRFRVGSNVNVYK